MEVISVAELLENSFFLKKWVAAEEGEIVQQSGWE